MLTLKKRRAERAIALISRETITTLMYSIKAMNSKNGTQ